MVCRFCIKDHHKGHTIITYEYLSKAEKNAGSAALSDKVMRMFGQEEEKITELAVKVLV